MKKFSNLILVIIMVLALAGCQLNRETDDPAAPDPLSELPPTLAPLGAETGAVAIVAGENVAAVAVVQPTATETVLQAGQTAVNPAEPVSPTSEVVPLNTNGAATDQTVVQAETFNPPADGSAATSEEAIVVDAADSLPLGGPVAANPPVGQTGGSYDVSAYGVSVHIVQPGDTLFSVAQQYGTSVDALMSANGLSSDLIDIGQQLSIPTGEAAVYSEPTGSQPESEQPAYDQNQPVYDQQPTYQQPNVAAGSGYYHVIQPGETLFRIALQYGTTVDAIAGANGIPYPYYINAGQQLTIPGPDSPYVAPPAPQGGFQQPAYPAQPDPSYQQPQGEYTYPAPDGTHTVSPGETLYSIAIGYGTTAEALAAANGLNDPNQIYVGQVLYLP